MDEKTAQLELSKRCDELVKLVEVSDARDRGAALPRRLATEVNDGKVFQMLATLSDPTSKARFPHPQGGSLFSFWARRALISAHPPARRRALSLKLATRSTRRSARSHRSAFGCGA